MNKSITLRIIMTVCLIIGLMFTVCACDSSGNAEIESNAQSNAPTSATTNAETEAPTNAETEAPTNAETDEESNETGYKMTVVDATGAPLEGVFLQICSGDLCLAPYFTDADGKCVVEDDLSQYTVKAYLDGYTAEKAEYAFENGARSIKIVMTKN